MDSCRSLSALLVVCFAALSLACGSPGAPQPPSLRLPKPPSDLAITRKADRIQLTFTPPRQTTDGDSVRRLGLIRICRSLEQPLMRTCDQVVGQLEPAQLPAEGKATFTHTLDFELQVNNPTALATYGVEALNPVGRSAGLSNQVRVPLAPTIPPPDDLRAELTPDGVWLRWSGVPHAHESPALSHLYRIFRRAAQAELELEMGAVSLERDPNARFVDDSIEWGGTYFYKVVPITQLSQDGRVVAEIEGADSNTVEVIARDTFPPSVPAGLQAVFTAAPGQRFVDLTWNPSTERDLAGYNIYRRAEGGRPARINRDLVLTPAFRDPQVEAGARYLYSVASVDVRDNESVRSEEAGERVPE